MAYQANQEGQDMSNHTPLPWNVVTIDQSIGSIEAADGSAVAQTQIRGTLRHPDHDERRANTDFIVRACNSHYELLEALEAQEAAEKWIAENDDSDPFFEATYTLMLQGSRLLRRAAIAKATGASQD